MKYITGRVLKRIRKGDHDALIGAIDYLIDLSHEDEFDMGYQSCLDDLEVYS